MQINVVICLFHITTCTKLVLQTLDEYDRRVEAALLELLRRRHSNDTEFCQGCEKCRATLDTSQPESPSTQATGAETGDSQRPLISSCKHEDEPVNFVVTLRDIENAFGPILQWRHRCWPDDSSYTFVTTEVRMTIQNYYHKSSMSHW